jgi:hypothetical protein
VETQEDKEYNKTLPDVRTRDPDTGVVGSDKMCQRLTFVCYFREKLVNCDEAKTRAYYKREGFDQAEETKKARRASIATLPIPGYTGTLEEAEHAMEHTPAGASAKLAKTRKAVRRRSKTEKFKRLGV